MVERRIKNKYMKNKKTNIIAGAVIVACVVFFAGFFVGKWTASPSMKPGLGSENFRSGAIGNRAGGKQSGIGQNMNIVSGEITKIDATSMTVGLQSGGSKLVFFSSSTQVMKTESGNAEDLKEGEQVFVTGQTNADGSVSASSIQLRGEEMMRAGK